MNDEPNFWRRTILFQSDDWLDILFGLYFWWCVKEFVVEMFVLYF